MKNKFVFLCSVVLLVGCSPRIHTYLSSTEIVKSVHSFVINDSLEVSLITAGDVRFVQDEKTAIQKVKTQSLNPNGLLAYGKTIIPPYYRIFIWLNPHHSIRDFGDWFFMHETNIQGDKLVIACRSIEGKNSDYEHSVQNDCEEIFKSITVGNSYRKKVPTIADLRKRIDNRYLTGLKAMRNYPAKRHVYNSIQLQMATTYASFIAPNNIYKKLLNKIPSPKPKNAIKQVIQEHSIKSQQAVFQTIIKEAKNERIAIFNESHYRPNHRILVTKLLPKFKKMGFEYLALEALWRQADRLLNHGHPPTIKMGFYVRDPHYGELLRTAQALGFTLVKYDSFGKKRELMQAKNIYAGTFAQDKNAKVLVLTGWGHILEKPSRNDQKRMAYLFKKKYGIDPLTISQTHLLVYSFMADPLLLIQSSVSNKPQFHGVDWILINNLKLLKTNSNFHFTNTFDKTVQPALFIKAEVDGINKAIPYRTGLVKPGETRHYKLPPNDYILVMFNDEGKILKQKEITRY